MFMNIFALWSIIALLVLAYLMVFRNTPLSEYDRLTVVQGNILR